MYATTALLARIFYRKSTDWSSKVNWLILGSKLPGKRLTEHPVDLRLWLPGAVDLREKVWLAVH